MGPVDPRSQDVRTVSIRIRQQEKPFKVEVRLTAPRIWQRREVAHNEKPRRRSAGAVDPDTTESAYQKSRCRRMRVWTWSSLRFT